MPRIALMLAIIAVSTSAPLIQWAKPASALTVASLRVLLASGLLALGAGRTLNTLAHLSRSQRLAVIGAGVLLAAHFAVWVSSLYFTSTTASVALVATQPVFAGLLGWLILRDPLRRREILGMAIAGLGCVLLASGDISTAGTSALWGDILALAGAITAAAYLVVGRRLGNALPLIPYLAAVNAVAGLLLLVAALAVGVQFIGLPNSSYLAIVLCALLPSLIGHSLLNYCARKVPVHLVSLGILGEPIGASLLALVFLGERPPTHAIAAGMIILAGIAIGFANRKSPSPPQ